MALHRSSLILLASAFLTVTGCGKDESTVPDVDLEIPEIVWVLGPDKPVSAGALVPVRFMTDDRSGVAHGTVKVSGAFDLDFEFDFPSLGRVNREWILQFPQPDVVDIEKLAVAT